MLRNGEIINNHLVLEYKGAGSFAHVYKVQHQATKNLFALKLCKSLDANDLNLFHDEHSILQTLSPHRNIIIPYSSPTPHTTSHLYYLMELADYALEKLLTSTQAIITDEEKVRIFHEVCEGLQHAHSNNILHRDLHWDNILVVRTNEIKISDFGLGKQFDANRFGNSVKPRWGGFVSPPEFYFEVHDDNTPISRYIPGDIYALGIVLYYLFDNIPMRYVSEIYDNMQDFIINKENLDLSTMDTSAKTESYKKWAKSVHTINNLDVYLKSDSASLKVNEIIKKATNPDLDLRYRTVGEILEEVQNIFI